MPSVVALLVVMISSCSSSDVARPGILGGLLGDGAAECVDARGPNSTPEQIVDAALAAPATNIAGETRTVSQKLAKDMQAISSVEYPTEAEYQQFVDGVFTDVPEGGDAAFAAAVCRLRAWDIKNGSYIYAVGVFPTSDTVRKKVGTTPHLLRGFGRQECLGASAGEKWEEDIQQLKNDLQQAKLDPESYKHSVLAGIDETLAIDPQIADPDLVAVVEASRQKVNETPAEEFVVRLEALYQITQLAVEHQCPQFRSGAPTLGGTRPFQ